MKKNNNILDEYFKLIILYSNTEHDALIIETTKEKSTETILKEDREQAFLKRLLTIDSNISISFGQLLAQKIKSLTIEKELLARESDLGTSKLEELEKDNVFFHTIPIKKLLRLFSYLQISPKELMNSLKISTERLLSAGKVTTSSTYLAKSNSFKNKKAIQRQKTSDRKLAEKYLKAIEKQLNE